MKKGISIFIIAIMLQCSFVSCNFLKSEEIEPSSATITESISSEVVESEEIKDLKFKIVSDWSAYLWFEEYLYGDMLWALSYIQQFIEEPTWENLQIARAALCTAESYISLREPQEITMTIQDYTMLMEQGYDVVHVPNEMGAMAQDKESVLAWCMQLKYGLFSEIYWEVSYENFSKYVDNLIEFCETNIDYIGYTTNYLLVTLEDEELSERLQNFIKENYVYFAKYFPEFFNEIDKIEKASITTLEELEYMEAQMELLLGNAIVSLDDLRDLVENQRIDVLREQFIEIKELPFFLPQVYWEDIEGATYQYYNNAEDGSMDFLEEQESIFKSSDGCIVQYTQVNKSDVIQYKEDLLLLGLVPIDVVEEENSLKIYYIVQENSLIIEWKDEIVTMYMLGGEICFAPIWFN